MVCSSPTLAGSLPRCEAEIPGSLYARRQVQSCSPLPALDAVGWLLGSTSSDSSKFVQAVRGSAPAMSIRCSGRVSGSRHLTGRACRRRCEWRGRGQCPSGDAARVEWTGDRGLFGRAAGVDFLTVGSRGGVRHRHPSTRSPQSLVSTQPARGRRPEDTASVREARASTGVSGGHRVPGRVSACGLPRMEPPF